MREQMSRTTDILNTLLERNQATLELLTSAVTRSLNQNRTNRTIRTAWSTARVTAVPETTESPSTVTANTAVTDPSSAPIETPRPVKHELRRDPQKPPPPMSSFVLVSACPWPALLSFPMPRHG